MLKLFSRLAKKKYIYITVDIHIFICLFPENRNKKDKALKFYVKKMLQRFFTSSILDYIEFLGVLNLGT